MFERFSCRVAAIVVLAVSTASAAAAAGPARSVLLDVPYISQTQQLCGGAAVAMVLRYWGDWTVLPQDFASLVDRSEGGIRTSALTDAVTRRGWQAVPVTPDANAATTWLAGEVDKGRPVIALIEVNSRTYHYVVVVGLTATEVVYHDPAHAPFRVAPVAEFDQWWAAANRWTLMVLPSTNRTPAASVQSAASTTDGSAETASAPCTALVAHSVTLAREGRLAEAERGFAAAQTLCPSGGAAELELGGIRFLQRRYAEAESLALNALQANPRDEAAWELLATSRYLQGDLTGALAAWNEIGRPRTDVIRIEGVERLDHPVIVDKTGLEPRMPLTPSDFARAERRLNELPTIKTVALNYFPRADGLADVRAALSERSVFPRGAMEWAAVGVNSLFRKELRILIAAPFRQGETWDIRRRWRPNRPRLRLAFSAPAPGRIPGVLDVEALWERQTYEPLASPVRQDRRRLAVELSDWVTDRIRWTAGGGADEFDGHGFVSVHGRLDMRWLDDHVSTIVSAGQWSPVRSGTNDRGFATGQAQVAWRSTRNVAAPEWLARAGLTAVSGSAPLGVWPVAGSGESRGPLLRAHQLHDNGIIVSDVFGRHLAFAALEYQQPVYARKSASLAIAGFADAGRAWERRFSPNPSPLHVDVGAGLRVSGGSDGEQLRVDFAYGLRDGQRTISAGYVVPWGQ